MIALSKSVESKPKKLSEEHWQSAVSKADAVRTGIKDGTYRGLDAKKAIAAQKDALRKLS